MHLNLTLLVAPSRMQLASKGSQNQKLRGERETRIHPAKLSI